MRTSIIIAFTIVPLALTACGGGLNDRPKLIGEKDGKPYLTMSGLSDNNDAAVERDIRKWLARACETQPTLINKVTAPQGITHAFQRWEITYTCDKPKFMIG